MSKRMILIAVVVLMFTFSISVSAQSLKWEEIFQNDEVQFVKMHTTAYCTGRITHNGSKVHVGGCACNPRMGQIAVVYTLDGQFIGMFECNDTGSTEGLQKGTVIDIYYPTLEECQEYMKKTQGKVMVQWIEGDG